MEVLTDNLEPSLVIHWSMQRLDSVRISNGVHKMDWLKPKNASYWQLKGPNKKIQIKWAKYMVTLVSHFINIITSSIKRGRQYTPGNKQQNLTKKGTWRSTTIILGWKEGWAPTLHTFFHLGVGLLNWNGRGFVAAPQSRWDIVNGRVKLPDLCVQCLPCVLLHRNYKNNIIIIII